MESPLQERLIQYLRKRLPATWWLAVGTSFSFPCGDARQAPVWMRKTGLEWAHRMYRDPESFSRRYLDGLPYAASLLGGAAVKRLARLLNRADKVQALDEAGDGAQRRLATASALESPPQAAAARSDINPGPNLVYQSFVSGFASELALEGPRRTTELVGPSGDGGKMLRNLRQVILLAERSGPPL